MAESSLSLGYESLCDAIGYEAGFGHDSLLLGVWQSWSSDQQSEVARLLNIGVRQVYYPPPINGQVHTWSFMRPIAVLTLWSSATGTMSVSTVTITDSTNSPFLPTMIGQTLVADTSENEYTIVGYTSSSVVTVSADATADDGDTFTITADGAYRLPDDFGGLVGDLTYNETTPHTPMVHVGEGHIRQLRQQEGLSGRPTMVAIRPVAFDPTLGQRYNLLPYPSVDQEYSVLYRYNRIPNELSTTNTQPYGGAQHAETFRASCLAAVEQELSGERGVRWLYFMERLAMSIELDRQIGSPALLGRMFDPQSSDEPVAWPRSTSFSYNGVVLDGT